MLLHYQTSIPDAQQLAGELNELRADSVRLLQADLARHHQVLALADAALSQWGYLDVLVNNAAQFHATPLGLVDEVDWDGVQATNLKAAFFLSQALASSLASRHGCIVNIGDIHAERGLPGYPVYSISKAGLLAMTKVLAKELAPAVRVNALAPGAILWPEHDDDAVRQAEILQKIPLQRLGMVEDIAKALRFLVCDADYVTGQVLAIDGGRLLFN